jgi:hypothetical protein
MIRVDIVWNRGAISSQFTVMTNAVKVGVTGYLFVNE